MAKPLPSHKRLVAEELFDMRLRALRRDRAYRSGPQLFLYERVFADILDRLSLIDREFGSVLLIGCPDPSWKQRLQAISAKVTVIEPGPCFAMAAGATCAVEDRMDLPPAEFDLCVAIGTLDSVNDLPAALTSIRRALRDGALFIGALSGGSTLPELRAAMRAADRQANAASPHVHPRIEPAALAALLTASGFTAPVVDVDDVRVSYGSFRQLLTDLREMGVTNVLKRRRTTPLSRSAFAVAAEHFATAGGGDKTIERFDILHFAGWAGIR